MEEQQSQTPQQQTPQNESPMPSQDPGTSLPPMPQDTPLMPAPPQTSIKQPKSKKGLIIGLIVALLMLGGIAAYFLVIKKDSAPAKTADNSTTEEAKKDETAKTAEPEPYGVLVIDYAKSANPYRIHYLDSSKAEQPLTGSESATSADVSGEIIAMIKHDDKTQGETLLVSTDAGKNFTTVYKGTVAVGNTSYGDQFSSVKITDDKSSVAFSVLVGGTTATTTNTNKTSIYDLTSKQTKEIFTSTTSGIFLTKVSNSTIYYRKGCMNCDGAPQPTLFSQTVSSPKETVVYEDKTKDVYVNIVPNSTVTKLLVQKASMNCDGPGGCKPYSVEEYDMATKTAKPLVTVTAIDFPPSFGYTTTDEPYFSSDKTLFTIKKGATVQSTLFEGAASILDVMYVNDKTAVFSTGDYSNSTVFSFDRATSKTTEVMKVSGTTRVDGVLVK